MMPLLKEDKKNLAKKYLQHVEGADNIVVLKQHGIPVNELNAVRMHIQDAQGRLEVVKKRVFLKGVEGTYEGLTLEEMEGSVAVLYSNNEEDANAPLKVISKHGKEWEKKKKKFGFDYIGGWYEKVRQGPEFVKELANLPSKEELLGKFVFLLNYPITSFARGLQAIADKGGEVAPEGTTTEVETPVVEEEVATESSEAAPTDDVPTEANEEVSTEEKTEASETPTEIEDEKPAEEA